MVFPLNMGGSWQFHPTTSNSQDDASYTVGVALYDAAGQRLCVGSSRATRPAGGDGLVAPSAAAGLSAVATGMEDEDQNWWFQGYP